MVRAIVITGILLGLGPSLTGRFPCHRDTLARVGYLRSPELPFVGSKDMIRVFRHALALDEVRAISGIHA